MEPGELVAVGDAPGLDPAALGLEADSFRGLDLRAHPDVAHGPPRRLRLRRHDPLFFRALPPLTRPIHEGEGKGPATSGRSVACAREPARAAPGAARAILRSVITARASLEGYSDTSPPRQITVRLGDVSDALDFSRERRRCAARAFGSRHGA